MFTCSLARAMNSRLKLTATREQSMLCSAFASQMSRLLVLFNGLYQSRQLDQTFFPRIGFNLVRRLSLGRKSSEKFESTWRYVDRNNYRMLALMKVLIFNKVLFESEMIEVRAKPHKILSQVIQHVLQKLQGKSSRPLAGSINDTELQSDYCSTSLKSPTTMESLFKQARSLQDQSQIIFRSSLFNSEYFWA